MKMMKETKSESITIRCTPKEKERIKRKAESKNINIGNYVLDSALAGLERRTTKERKRAVRMVERQEEYNHLYRKLMTNTLNESEMRSALLEIIEREKEEWRNF